MSNGSGTWRIGDAVAWTTSGSDVVALDLSSPDAAPMTLQQTAAYVWEELDAKGPISSDELVQLAAEAYGVNADHVRADVLGLLDQLRGGRLAAFDDV